MNTVIRNAGFILLLAFTFTTTLQAQIQEIESEEKEEVSLDENKTGWKNRIVVGGNLSAGFGSFTYVDVSPLVGYKITKDLTAGVGFTYQFYKVNYNDPFYILDYKGNVFGGRLFTEYDLFYGLFAHVEYEHLWYNMEYEDAYYGVYKGDVPALFLGGGYNFMMGDNAKFQVMVLYDVLNRSESLYNSPWVIRMGISVGL